MKYKQHLKANIAPEYGSDVYLDYSGLDDIIRELSSKIPLTSDGTTDGARNSRTVSFTSPSPSSSTPLSEEIFFTALDHELSKVESFTLSQVTHLRSVLTDIEKCLASHLRQSSSSSSSITSTTATVNTLRTRAENVGDSFIRLEKYVNVNFMGFHKILKKHDKYIPGTPCKSFYVNRMHAQAWVRGDYSDVVVRLSAIFSDLRNDRQVIPETMAAVNQSFLRSTSKYWIKTEDVSRVKYFILRHLPVFLQKTSSGKSDSQLINSVYLDNDQLELYHGRLDKSPGAIALRLRWYGLDDPPTTVFVERKTHRDKWTGEVSAKERFVIDESEVKQVMTNTYPISEIKKERLSKTTNNDRSIENWERLVWEVTQVIHSKQLVPTLRTQYMRTAFQIPFDATVRISLDTNLCMISERNHYSLFQDDDDNNNRHEKSSSFWHRPPSETIAPSEITRFPHAILEIKLELSGDDPSPPPWVVELQRSGLLYEVHKFSKFIHGCAVLLPDDVMSMPYWVDDASLRDSIQDCGKEWILKTNDFGTVMGAAGPGANIVYNHLLPFGAVGENGTLNNVGRTALSYDTVENHCSNTASDDDACDFLPCLSGTRSSHHATVAPTRLQKIEPKSFFANERTFLHYLHISATLSSVAAGVLAFLSDDDDSSENGWAQWYAMALLGISLGFCVYATHVFLWRNEMIHQRVPGRWDDTRGPLLAGVALVVVLVVNLAAKVLELVKFLDS